MRAAAMSVWIFINLLCFGMCGYLYLIWSQFWMYKEKQMFPIDTLKTDSAENYRDTYQSKNGYNKVYNSSVLLVNSVNKRSAVGAVWSGAKNIKIPIKSEANPSKNIERRIYGGPRFPNVHVPVIEFDSEKYVCNDYTTSDCIEKTSEFKELLLKEFHRVLMSDSKVYRSGLDVHNTYNVKYKGHWEEMSRDKLRCVLKKIVVQLVGDKDEPFGRLGYRIPARPLLEGRVFNTCAVVTSAGALLGSRLGEFIDNHDAVIRFNNAPTENYTEDVGSKTTLRVLNSQVVTKPEYDFMENPLFRNVSILIWDPANYSASLEEWYNHPDFPLFPVYKKLLEERRDADVHLLKPQVLWELWSVLQDTSPYRLRKNPPSSGFIGVWFALHRCRAVRVFEYVPSSRATRRCHYHAAVDNAACTLGAWHPLAQEKALAERMRCNGDIDVFQRGHCKALLCLKGDDSSIILHDNSETYGVTEYDNSTCPNPDIPTLIVRFPVAKSGYEFSYGKHAELDNITDYLIMLPMAETVEG